MFISRLIAYPLSVENFVEWKESSLYICKNSLVVYYPSAIITYLAAKHLHLSIHQFSSRSTDWYLSGNILRILKEIDKVENRESIGTGNQKLLEVLGNYGNADRTYLFETVHTPEIFTNTYEWCADGITAQRDNLQDVKFEWDIDNEKVSISYKNENINNSLKDYALDYRCKDINIENESSDSEATLIRLMLINNSLK